MQRGQYIQYFGTWSCILNPKTTDYNNYLIMGITVHWQLRKHRQSKICPVKADPSSAVSVYPAPVAPTIHPTLPYRTLPYPWAVSPDPWKRSFFFRPLGFHMGLTRLLDGCGQMPKLRYGYSKLESRERLGWKDGVRWDRWDGWDDTRWWDSADIVLLGSYKCSWCSANWHHGQWN